jgi:hypothetical protein
LPVLLAAASRTGAPIFDADAVQYLAEHIADPTVRELPGAGHFAPNLAPSPSPRHWPRSSRRSASPPGTEPTPPSERFHRQPRGLMEPQVPCARLGSYGRMPMRPESHIITVRERLGQLRGRKGR